MAPRVKITKEEIIKTAVDLVKAGGVQALNARAIAAALNCSTQPVFSNFPTMEKLQEEVTIAAYDLYLGFLKNEAESGQYPKYKSYGLAYIRFAKEEKELFKLLYMCDRQEKEITPTLDFKASVQMIMDANGVTKDKAERMHLEMWTCVHGIATMIATSFLSFEWEFISDMLSDIYQGIRLKHLEGRRDACMQ